MSIIVTGATGQLGHLVVEQLLENGVPAGQIVAAGRDVAKAADLGERGVVVAAIDFDEPTTLEGLLSAGDTVLLVSSNDMVNRMAHHRAVIDAASRAGAARLVYTSALAADTTPLVLAPDHLATEHLIRASGLTFTILRNGWYTENYVQAFGQAAESGVLLASVGQGRVASASRADYAAAAAAVLAGDTHDGAVYELSGDTSWDFTDLAAAFAQVAGRDVTYQAVSSAEHLAILTGAGLDDQTAAFVVALDANTADGALALTTGDLSRLAGRPTTSLLDSVATFA